MSDMSVGSISPRMVQDTFSATASGKTADLTRLKGFVEHLVYFFTAGLVDDGEPRAQDLYQAFRSGPTSEDVEQFSNGGNNVQLRFTFASDAGEITMTIERGQRGLSLTAQAGDGNAVTRWLPDSTDITGASRQLMPGHLKAVLADLPPEQKMTLLLQPLTDDGVTVLMLAAENGYDEVIKAALAGLTPEQKMTLLQQSRPDNGATALMLAACKGHDKVTEAALAGLTPEQKMTLLLQTCTDGATVLMLAAQDGYGKVIAVALADLSPEQKMTLLQQTFTDDDATDATALMMAAQEGYVKVIEAALAGLTQEEIMTLLLQPCNDGATFLMLAAQDGYDEVIQAALAGLTLEQKMTLLQQPRPDGATALMMAAQEGYVKVIEAALAGLTQEQKHHLLYVPVVNDSVMDIARRAGCGPAVERLLLSATVINSASLFSVAPSA